MFTVIIILASVIALLAVATHGMAYHYERKRKALIADAQRFTRMANAYQKACRSEYEANESMQSK